MNSSNTRSETYCIRRATALVCLILLSACTHGARGPKGPPPVDPIATVSPSQLRAQGLSFARAGDLTRAQQYLAAAYSKGYDETQVLPEIVKVCVAASRLRAALSYAEPYLDRHPGDAGMSYVVGSIHLALGNLQQASAHLNGALEPGELVIDAAYSLALVESRQGLSQEARAHLQHYLQVAPQGAYASRALRLLAKLNREEVQP